MRLRFRLSALIFGIVLTFSPANAQEPIQIKVADRYTLAADQVYRHDPARHDATHQLTLTLVYFTGSDWPRNAMVEAARKVAEILERCGMLLWQVELVRVDAPRRYHYLNTPKSRELARTLQLAKPTVYFVTDTRHRPAFDAEAIGRGNSQTRPELADSVWVTRATRDVGVALAHELVHVLSDSGQHVDLPGNLMREQTAPENTQLTGAQCAQLREVGAKNGLLHVMK
ncbi:MAG: hypothetical protein WD823_09380 [Sulfuricaulis sp.]|uniref:hypothetical protein n=1 Tax=Sulfuricaulis sp. TaxID=2003553 RepID=UPI0034A34CCC